MTFPKNNALRGFECITQYQNCGIELPSRKTKTSAGYDFQAAETIEIQPGEIRLVPTGIKAFMQDDEALKLYARSSLAIAKQLILANGVGVIDQDYYNNETNEGHILLPLYNASKQVVIIQKGERVAQGIFEKYLASEIESRPQATRKGGFGSTGK